MSTGNLIEENLIYRVMRELHDGAAIYGNMDACVIRGNVAAFKAGKNTLKALGEMAAAAGLVHPSGFLPHHLLMREKDRDMVTGDEVYPYMPEGFLLREDDDRFGYLKRWRRASASQFEPLDDGV